MARMRRQAGRRTPRRLGNTLPASQGGDAGNAAYWYRRAGQPVCKTSLDEEWVAIASALLAGKR